MIGGAGESGADLLADGRPKRLYPEAIIIFLLVMFSLSAGSKSWKKPPTVRVKVGDISSPKNLSGKNLRWSAGPVKGEGQALVAFSAGKITVNKRPASFPVTFMADGPISVGGEAFRGDLVISSGGPPIIINHVDLESYVAGVINQEIDSRWPEAAVDAQAILARTYAIRKARAKKDAPYDLERTVADQVYGGVAAEDELAWASVERTRSLVLMYNGEPAAANYHGCCGGRTELPSSVWGGKDEPYHKSVVCPYCRNAPRYFWRFPERGAMSGRELASMLGLAGSVKDARVSKRTAGGRALSLTLAAGSGTIEMAAKDFRSKIGYSRVFSTAFEIEAEREGFVIRGSGSGHGAGLCQWGARGMAEAGAKSKEILDFYFPGTGVEPWDPA